MTVGSHGVTSGTRMLPLSFFNHVQLHSRLIAKEYTDNMGAILSIFDCLVSEICVPYPPVAAGLQYNYSQKF